MSYNQQLSIQPENMATQLSLTKYNKTPLKLTTECVTSCLSLQKDMSFCKTFHCNDIIADGCVLS